MAAHVDEQGLLDDDVENQLSPSPHQSSPKTTPITPNPNVPPDNLHDKAATKEESAQNSASNTDAKMNEVTLEIVSKSFQFFIICIFILVAFPVVLVYVIASVCFTGSFRWPNECFSSNKNVSSPSSDSKTKGIYSKIQEFEPTKKKIQRLNFVATTRLGCLALLWLVVNLCVPSLSGLALFGYPLWKWSLLVVIILLGYPSAALTILHVAAIIGLYNDEFTHKKNLVYFMEGLEDSFTGLLHFLLIFLMWVLYFRTDRGLNPSTKFDKFGTWTFVSLLVGAFLWVLKSAAMLEWKAKAVYKRFKGRILIAGIQLYLLKIVTHNSMDPELLPWRALEEQALSEPLIGTSDGKTMEATKNNKNIATDVKESPNITMSTLSKKVTTDQLYYMAERITSLPQVIQREDEDISDFVAQYEDKFLEFSRSTGLQEEAIRNRFRLTKNELDFLTKELCAWQMSTCDDEFRKLMVDAHKNCLSVGYTLIDAFAMVSILNKVIIGFLVVMFILIWLLATELATTKVLVLVASPILALSFVFGDTCKTFFQGFIFSFVTHPYDVGDRCIIDEMELEVKQIGILTTTFLRIGTKEKMMYPHASLATKLISNLEGEPDPNDMIELKLDSSTTRANILKLKKDLKSFFKKKDEKKKRRHGSYDEDIDVTLEEIGSSIKVRICFKHVMNVHDVSNSQCLQKKNKQRSKLLIAIKEILEKHKIKLATC